MKSVHFNMLGLVQRHRRGQKLIEEDRLTRDQVDMQDWRENGGECEDILVSNHQVNLLMNCLHALG